MRPTTDSERIRFRKKAGPRYRLVHERTLEGSSNLSCVVRLVEEEMGVKLERKGVRPDDFEVLYAVDGVRHESFLARYSINATAQS